MHVLRLSAQLLIPSLEHIWNFPIGYVRTENNIRKVCSTINSTLSLSLPYLTWLRLYVSNAPTRRKKHFVCIRTRRKEKGSLQEKKEHKVALKQPRPQRYICLRQREQREEVGFSKFFFCVADVPDLGFAQRNISTEAKKWNGILAVFESFIMNAIQTLTQQWRSFRICFVHYLCSVN